MNWILIAIISGMITTTSFDTEEACLGRKAMLEKDRLTNVSNIKCISMIPSYSSTNGTITTCCNSTNSTQTCYPCYGGAR